ncbi:MATE family efflux transporter [Asticcacaulis solisilvae]|uniref:MATE family efflux transporter n=1 Tax=Asticcacaulis solisilvae TaxID=1217274 RepID=UPI003FD794CF
MTPDVRAAFAALYRLSWPVAASRVGVMLMAFLDTVIVGRYSSAELSFLMLSQALFWVPAVASMGLLMGIQVKTAHFLGAGDLHRIGAVFQRGMIYAVVMGFGLMVLLLVAGIGFLSLIVRPELAAGARMPLIVFAASMPMFLVLTGCSQFLEALSRTRDVMITTLIANALNVVLLLVLVPGHVAGIHGAMGAAVATLVARSLQAVALFVHILRLKETKPYDLLGHQAPDHEAAVEQRHIGYAAGASYFIEAAAFAGMTMFAGRISEEAVAAWSIILNFASIVFMVPMGLSAGCSVLVGKAYGAHDREGLKLMGRVSFVSAAAFMTSVVVLMLVFAGPLTHLYTTDPDLQPLVHQGLLLSCLFYIPDGLQVVAAQALRARKDVLAPTVIHYLSYGAIMLPLGFVFALTLGWGTAGLVGAVVVASAVSGTFQTGRFLWLDKA